MKYIITNLPDKLKKWQCPNEIANNILKLKLEPVKKFSMKNFSYDDKKYWGSYYTVYESKDQLKESKEFNDFAPVRKEKILIINPNTKLTLQSHKFKDEYWFAMTDNVSFFAGENSDNIQCFDLKKGEIVRIKAHECHCLMNKSNRPAVIYEIQTGFCHEGDVTRYSDMKEIR